MRGGRWIQCPLPPLLHTVGIHLSSLPAFCPSPAPVALQGLSFHSFCLEGPFPISLVLPDPECAPALGPPPRQPSPGPIDTPPQIPQD